jgi:hypothetical protein
MRVGRPPVLEGRVINVLEVCFTPVNGLHPAQWATLYALFKTKGPAN